MPTSSRCSCAPADARAAFERGAVDAWVIWDPFLAAAEAATGARTLADGTGLVANHQFYFASTAVPARPTRRSSMSCWRSSARSTTGRKSDIQAVAEQLAPVDRHAGRRSLEVALEAAGLRHQADHRRRDRRAAADRRHVPRLGLIPKPIKISDAVAEVRHHERHAPPNANVLWFLPTHGDGRYLGTTERRPRGRSRLSAARSRRRPTGSATTACCCRPGGAARIPGSSPRRWRR